MLDVSDVILKNIIVHKVGNKSKDENLIISESPLDIDDSFITEILNKYFLSPFKGEAFFNLTHQSDIKLNEVYSYAKAIFNNTSSFYIESIHLANHLYENATHPKINSGEYYIVLFENIRIEGERTQALGLFKSENKETYLKVFQKNKNFEIQSDEGVNINKLDKGCLIFNLEEQNGYKCLIVDALNKQNEAQYWKDDFLNLKPCNDEYFKTQNFLGICKDFCNEIITPENNYSKQDQIVVKKKSIEYFSKKDNFDIQEFQHEVVKDFDLKESFKNFLENYKDENGESPSDSFEISKPAIKEQKKFFKSILKLDKNFHVYVHGNHEQIEKGYDEERNMHFYKLFYKNES